MRSTGTRNGVKKRDSILDLEAAMLRVRNKPKLGWQIKTRSERGVPLVPVLVDVLRVTLGDRRSGPVFRQRRCGPCEGFGNAPQLSYSTISELETEAAARVQARQTEQPLSRCERLSVLGTIWRDLAVLKEDRLRLEFIRLARRIGQPHATAPKALRHSFATALQDVNVDPLVRNMLMGHTPDPAGGRGGGGGGGGRPCPGLGMTAVYTHTRPQTVRQQLEMAMAARPALEVAQRWLATRRIAK
jgi:hypothetical protein